MIKRGESGESNKTVFCLCSACKYSTDSNWELKVKLNEEKLVGFSKG